MSIQGIEHNSEKERFTLRTEEGEAVLEYRLLHTATNGGDKPTGVNFTYTYVPPELRGKGLAEALVRHGLRWAEQQKYQVTATCWYAAKFLH